ncbi:serine hydrolase domain-containing protein [Culicoidibacter larvae]|uniref:Beta-lactamase family protein n=1 Tax=Culicoidibacter larvae TaxID=2579976 RepID=A0A5R8QH89_9FIRM|nr:serine hydrolase domain-containing protein [Culicoidibacter larvae]TLG77134.1 beta-lactamase family protein [Culicoidibacter larvae]
MKEFKIFTEQLMKDYSAAGLRAALFTKDGTIKYQRSFGYRDIDEQRQISADSLFGVASVTKSFTALAIMQLVEAGRVELDALVSVYIPEFENKRGVTVRHLLSHSGGFFPQHRTTVYEVAEKLGLEPQVEDLAFSNELAMAGSKEICRLLDAATEFCGAPGAFLSYSNDGYGLLTEIVRRVSGYETYAAYLEACILKPLGMTRSTIAMLAPQHDTDVATLYWNENGELKSTLDFYDNAFVMMGGGALKSTLNDLMKYVCMYLHGGVTQSGEQLLSQAGIEQMSAPAIRYNAQSNYGFGLAIETIGGQKCVGHGGGLTGVSSQILWSAEVGLGVVVLCNTSAVPVSLVASRLLALGLSAEIVKPEYSFIEDAGFIEQVAGVYASDEEDSCVQVVFDEEGLRVWLGATVYPARLTDRYQVVIEKPYSDVVLEFNQEHRWVRLGGRLLPKQ